MNTSSESIKQIVSKVMRTLGYRKHLESNWSKDYPDMIHIIGLQKSRWGMEYYLEAAIWLKIFGPTESPKFYECQVKLRLNFHVGPQVGDIESALNEEDYWKMDPEERFRIISTALKSAETEFFDKARTLEGLRGLIVSQPKFKLIINKSVREFFNIPLPNDAGS